MQRRRQHFAREAEILTKILKDGHRSSAFRAHDAKSIARVLISATNALLPFSLSTAELGQRKDVETLAKRTADLLISGLEQGGAKRS